MPANQAVPDTANQPDRPRKIILDCVPGHDDAHAVDFIIDTVMSEPAGTVTLVPTGPLTNIAMAARKEPAIVDRVAEVVLMGGGYHEGNTTAVAEFNISVDPEAAHIVFNEK